MDKETLQIDLFQSNRVSDIDFLRIVDCNNKFVAGILSPSNNGVIYDLKEVAPYESQLPHKATFFCSKKDLIEILSAIK